MALERTADPIVIAYPLLASKESAEHPAASGYVMEPEVRVAIRSLVDVVTARQQGRAISSRLGFSSSNLSIIAAAISEVARNIVDYAKEGELRMALVETGSRRGVRIVATDSGPGIEDIDIVMRDGYSTGQGLGIGLPGSRRLMDDFEIESVVGQGTTITMTKWVP